MHVFLVIVIQLMFLGINMFLTLLKNESESGQKYIYAREHQLLLYYTP